MNSINIISGGFCILAKCNDKSVLKSISKNFGLFVTKKPVPDFIINLTIGHSISYGKWKLDYKRNICTIQIKKYDKATFLWVLRIIFSIVCYKNNAILLHSAAVISKRKAYVFCGPPEAGKSTISSLSYGLTLLNDDYVIIKKINAKFTVFGTILGGEYLKYKKILKPNNAAAKINKIFFIRQASKHRIEKKSQTDAMQELLKEVFYYHDGSKQSNKLIESNFNMVYNLCKGVDLYNLYFQKNSGFWKEIEKLR